MTQQHLEIIHGSPFALRHDGSGHLADLPAPVHPLALKNLTDLEAVERLGDRVFHQNRSACQPHSDDSYDDESLDRRHAALVLPELPQEASGDDHVCLLYGVSSRLLPIL